MSCSIVVVERRFTAVVKAKVPFLQIPDAQRSARRVVAGALTSIAPGSIGRPCTRFCAPASDALDMEIGTIVGHEFPPHGEVVPSDLPAGRAAHFVLKGSFAGLSAAWQMLF